MDDDVWSMPLVEHLEESQGKTRRTHGRRRAEGNNKRRLTRLSQRAFEFPHAGRAVRAAGHEVKLGAEKFVETCVAGRYLGGCARENQVAFEAEFRRGRRGGSTVVRLNPATSNHRVGTRPHGLGHHQLEFADLVAAETERDRVVPFDEDRMR